MAGVRLPPPGRGAGNAGARRRSTGRAATSGVAHSRIETKRIYEAGEESDGTRVLVMRYWPRGVRKDRVDVWLRELAPVVPLLRAYLDGKITWKQYTPRYLAGLARPEARAALAEARELARRGRITLLCGCPVAARCHRTLLRRHLLESGG